MEAVCEMRKILLYATAAAILGILLTLTPLLIATEVKPEPSYFLVPESTESLRQVSPGYGLEKPLFSNLDFAILASSLVIASIGYVISRRKFHATS